MGGTSRASGHWLSNQPILKPFILFTTSMALPRRLLLGWKAMTYLSVLKGKDTTQMPDALAMGWESISPPQREDTRPVSLIHSSCLQSSRSTQDHPLSSQLLSPNKPAATNKNTSQVLKRPLSVVPREGKKNIPSCLSLKMYFSKKKKKEEKEKKQGTE